MFCHIKCRICTTYTSLIRSSIPGRLLFHLMLLLGWLALILSVLQLQLFVTMLLYVLCRLPLLSMQISVGPDVSLSARMDMFPLIPTCSATRSILRDQAQRFKLTPYQVNSFCYSFLASEIAIKLKFAESYQFLPTIQRLVS